MTTYPYILNGGVLYGKLPNPDTNDTYNWADVQKVRQGAQITKLSGGQNLDGVSVGLLYFDGDGNPGVLEANLTRSNKWFTLTDASVGQDGKILYKLAASQSTKTSSNRVAIVRLSYTAKAPGAPIATEWYISIGN
ncbi:MAG: hypothetical protein LQ342_000707 [Letrouitia transgressa]|nr:MAG: hypothetical protein LQ342_000707 [Letrouitia transgressa]